MDAFTLSIFPRYLADYAAEVLSDTPVTLIHGARQTGKTTFAEILGNKHGHEYITFDDENQRQAALSDPQGYVRQLPKRVILDEVQRVPDLFLSLKAAVDRNRMPGRFILTGSANIMLLPHIADSLAGRIEVLNLHPLAQSELNKRKPELIQRLKERNLSGLSPDSTPLNLPELLTRGGYPSALARGSSMRRGVWYHQYIQSIVLRDLKELTQIHSIDSLPRLLKNIAGNTAHLLNVSDLATPFQLTRPTIKDYFTLLRHVFLVYELPVWHSNKNKRLVKTPKVHLNDSGLACGLLGISQTDLQFDRQLLAQLLETFVFNEFQRMLSWQPGQGQLYHYRDKDGYEIDLILELSNGKIIAIEVKAAESINQKDFRTLKNVRDRIGEQFIAGYVFYNGVSTLPFGDRLHALPLSLLKGL